MQMRSICAMCFVPCALLLWLGSSCIIVDSLVDIMFLSITTFLCMRVSLWMHIMLTIGHLEPFIHKKVLIGIIYSLSATWFVLFWLFGGFGKRLKVSACMHCIYPCAVMCSGCILDPYLTWWSHWIFLFYLVQNMFFGSFECFPPMFNLIFISYYLVAF